MQHGNWGGSADGRQLVPSTDSETDPDRLKALSTATDRIKPSRPVHRIGTDYGDPPDTRRQDLGFPEFD